MKGACSNQIVKCIIYTSNLEVGQKKLAEIEKEKCKQGIDIIKKAKSLHYNKTLFDDDEEWIIVNPNRGARGYRWRKAWIDVKTSYEQIRMCVLPYGDLYKLEEAKYFNWD